MSKSPKKVTPARPATTDRATPTTATASSALSAARLPLARRQEDVVWGRLTLSLNAKETSTFELKGDKAQIVGRAAGCDVSIALPHISATHCSIRDGERGAPAP